MSQTSDAVNADRVTIGTRYVVVDEHTLGYIQEGQTNIGILAASILRGASHTWKDGPLPMPIEAELAAGLVTIRPATLEDFNAFRVCPKGHI
jgi:hypothetical protein